MNRTDSEFRQNSTKSSNTGSATTEVSKSKAFFNEISSFFMKNLRSYAIHNKGEFGFVSFFPTKKKIKK